MWTGLSAWVSSQLERGRAVNVPQFFKIQFQSQDGTRPMSQMSNRSGRGTPRATGELGAPVFILSDEFIMQHKCLFRANIPPGSSIATGVPIVDLQYSAVSQVCGVDKDTCQVLLKTLMRRLGEMIARGALVEVELPGNGVISAANKSVSFVPTVLTRAAMMSSGVMSPRNAALSPRASMSPRSASQRSAYGANIGGVMQPREEIAPSVTPAPRMTPVPPPTPAPAQVPQPQEPGIQYTLAPGLGNDSSAAANAMIYRSDAKPRRIRGEGIVPAVNDIGKIVTGSKHTAYPNFLLPERGLHVNPTKTGKKVDAQLAPAYSRYQQDLYKGIDQTQKQLSEIDTRWRDAIKTDQLKMELMRAKAGEINSFLQKQILEKQARQEAERERRMNTPDVFARTGYPPVNSPSRDLRAAEVAMMQKMTLSNALASQMTSKDELNRHAHESELRTELVRTELRDIGSASANHTNEDVQRESSSIANPANLLRAFHQVNLKTLAGQLEAERSTQKKNQQLTRATLKDSWERHSAVRSISLYISLRISRPASVPQWNFRCCSRCVAAAVAVVQLKNIERRLNELEGKS